MDASSQMPVVRSRALLAGQNQALQLAVGGAALADVLEVLARTAEAESDGGILASILLLDAEGRRLRHGAAPALPAAYNAAIDGIDIGPQVGSCGTAAFHDREVVVTDIASDPLWADFRELAGAHGLRACWSTPIHSSTGAVLGTLALYYRVPRGPSPQDREVVQLLSNTAAVVIERDRATAERERVEASLREANQRKDEFLATLAHELRNPLAPLGNAVAMLRADGAGRVGQVLPILERQLGQLARLVDDLLDVSRVNTGKMDLRPEPVALREIVEAAVETSQPLVRKARHHLQVVQGPEPLVVHGDRARLAQILTNLLNNAAKYTPDGGRIELRTAARDGQAVVQVRDSGMGIPPEMLARVFDAFTQVDHALPHSQGGLGLGLTLVKKLAVLHGGDVTAESPGPGQGSTFTLRLPLATAAELPAPDDAVVSAAPDGTPARLPILVVDDNADAAESLAMLLQLADHDTATAHSGRDALALALRLRPRAVFLDIGLPDMSGYEVAQAMRAEPSLRGVGLIALTGWGTESDQQRALDAGFDYHLTKPAGVEQVYALLDKMAAG